MKKHSLKNNVIYGKKLILIKKLLLELKVNLKKLNYTFNAKISGFNCKF